VFRAVREAMGESEDILVGPNQAFSVPEAIRRAHRYADRGVGWLEEPVRADDLASHAAVARTCPRLPVQP
jgi:L-alanine-DL-glutamate epimerase-like enolase superfamily enzyme